MHELLRKVLEKAGVEDVSQLTADEKADYDRYSAVLERPEISVDDITVFCRVQKDNVESQFGNIDDSPEKKERLLFLHFVYSKLIKLITGSKAERAATERELEDLLKK